MDQQKILAALKGATSAKPMSFADLQKEVGLEESTLAVLLDHMCQTVPFSVNRCHITRAGKPEWYYWPTGVVGAVIPLGNQSVSHNRPVLPPRSASDGRSAAPIRHSTEKPASDTDLTVSPAATRVTSPTESIATSMAEKAIRNVENAIMQEQTPAPAKTKIRIMLELIAEKGTVSSKELGAAVNTSTTRPFLKPYLAKKLIVGVDGTNGREYSLAPGVNPEDLLIVAAADFTKRRRALKTVPKPPQPQPQKDNVTKLQPKTANSQPETANETPVRHYDTSQIGIDPTGQLIIQEPGLVKRVFPREATLQIKKFLNAIDLESLCA